MAVSTPEFLRTPDARFDDLPGYPFVPHYAENLPGFAGLRMHYLDEGDRASPVILLTPSQGCWVYMYRKLIPLLTAAGFRILAPDYIGFGRSDKLLAEDMGHRATDLPTFSPLWLRVVFSWSPCESCGCIDSGIRRCKIV